MSGLESKPSFRARAIEIGAEEAYVDALVAAGVDSFGKLAFICGASPASGDDAPLTQAVTDLLGAAPSAAEMMILRRLWFEAHAFALADLKSKTEKSPSETMKTMPLPERMARLDAQKKRLTGIIFDAHNEPSHHLVDKVQSMIDEGVLSYIPPSKCTSRSHEVQSDRTAMQVQFDSSGNLKVCKKETDLQCETSGELQLRMALTRRSLAFDQAGLVSYNKQEMWHSHMISTLLKQPPAGHKFVSMQQLMAADKEIWERMSQESRGSLRVVPGQDAPLDALFDRFMYSPEVTCYMTPLPAGSSSSGGGSSSNKDTGRHQNASQPKKVNKPFTKQNQKNGPLETIKEMLANLPKGCSSKLPNGRFICLRYNKGTCPNQKKSSCKFGLHVCYYVGCGKNNPYIECSH